MRPQKDIWDEMYRESDVKRPPSEFAIAIGDRLREPSDILELGCGVGSEAEYFAARGHRVFATDFSETCVRRNTARFTGVAGLSFCLLGCGIFEPSERLGAFRISLAGQRCSGIAPMSDWSIARWRGKE